MLNPLLELSSVFYFSTVCVPLCFILNLSYKLMQTKSGESETCRSPVGRNKGNNRSANSIRASLNLTQQIQFRFTASSSRFLLTVFLLLCRMVCTSDLHPVNSSVFFHCSLYLLIPFILIVLLSFTPSCCLLSSILLSSPLHN